MIARVSFTTVVIAGDIAIFAVFVIFGKAEHNVAIGQALIRTALPFGLVWILCSPWLGAYKISTLYNLSSVVWKIPSIWFLCSLVALVARVVLTDASFVLSFAIVSIVVQAVLLVIWRGVFMLGTTRFRPDSLG